METEGKRRIQVMKFIFMRENKVGEYWRVKKQNKRSVNQEELISVPLSYIGKTTGEVDFWKQSKKFNFDCVGFGNTCQI